MRLVIYGLFVVTLVTPALAIMDHGTGSLGVYFDYPNCECVGPGTAIQASVPVDMYFVMANPPFAALGGFEFSWAFDPVLSPVVLETTLPPGAMNIGTNTNLIVGLGSMIPTSEATLLVTLRLQFLQTPSPSHYITVGPAVPASLPGHAAYNNWDNPADIRIMDFHTIYAWYPEVDSAGWMRPGVGWLAGCYIPVEGTTWGNVKATFR